MTGGKLFFKRLWNEWRYQIGVIGSVFDWTIILYLVIPALVVAPFLYMDMWEYIELYWSAKLPVSVLVFLFLLLSTSGNYRTYLMEGDLVFLIQRKKLLFQLKLFGFLTSILQIIMGQALLFVVAYPILILIYEYTFYKVLSLFLAVMAFRMLAMLGKKVILRNLYKWISFVILFLVAFELIVNLDPLSLGYGSLFIILSVVVYQLTQISKTNRWFLREIEIESEEVIRYIRLIFAFSPQVEKEVFQTRKRPLPLFRKSGRIFSVRSPENGLLELTIKAFLRNRSHLKTYFQLCLITSSAILVLPVWIKWLVYPLFAFFMQIWLRNIFEKMLSSSFFMVVSSDKELLLAVWPRFKKRFFLPAIGFAGIVAVFSTLFAYIIAQLFP